MAGTRRKQSALNGRLTRARRRGTQIDGKPAAKRSAPFGKICARREGVRKWPRTALTEGYTHPRIARLPQHLPPATCSSAMAGSPLKRQCNLGVVADDGSVIAFPRLNHLRSGLSHGRWRTLSPGEKIEKAPKFSKDCVAGSGRSRGKVNSHCTLLPECEPVEMKLMLG